VFGSRVACDGDDADVEEVDEEFVGSDFLRFFGAPEEAFVEVLTHNGLLVEKHVGAEFALGAPCGFVEGGCGVGIGAGVAMIVSSQVSGVSVLGEVSVELDGVLGDHVQFGGESVKIPDYAFKFVGEVSVLLLESAVMRFVVSVGVSERFYLKSVS
jgi:hypothetical protein